MPDEPTPQPLTRPWTPERIQQYMQEQHGITWAPPSVEETLIEPNLVGDRVEPGEQWSVYELETDMIRPLTPQELFDVTEKVHRTHPGYDEAADLPRDHRQTPRETVYVQDAMKERGVPAETRAQARWAARMDPQQSRSQAMTQSMARHPSNHIASMRPSVN